MTPDPVAAAQAVVARAAAADSAIWIGELPGERLLAAARALARRGPDGLPLYGLTFAVKDNLDVAGWPTTAGCPGYAYAPEETAPVVQRLLDAGALLAGKTNLDQFATGLVGTRSPYGTPRNPLDADVIPGGSSSGSAVAVAAGVVDLALGTDTAGSGRVPAALTGCLGLKPTRGLLSTRGLVPACRSLDVVSVFARSAADAAAAFAVAAAFDPQDPWARAAPPPRHRQGPLRVGVVDDADLAPIDPAAAAVPASQAKALEAAGATLKRMDPAPLWEAGALLYEGPWVAERWASLGAFVEAHPEEVHPVTARVLASAARWSASDVFRAQHRLAELRLLAAALWDQVDVLLLPTLARVPTLRAVRDDPLGVNTELGRFTNFANLLDLCAVVPAAVAPDGGVPAGATLFGPAGADALLLEVAAALEPASAAAPKPPAAGQTTTPRGQSTKI